MLYTELMLLSMFSCVYNAASYGVQCGVPSGKQLRQVIQVMQVDKCRSPKCGCKDAMQTSITNTVTMKYASFEVILLTQ